MELGRSVHLASEEEVEDIFVDCARGAVPPVGECYGLDVIVDNSLNDHSDFYIEGGRSRHVGAHDPPANSRG